MSLQQQDVWHHAATHTHELSPWETGSNPDQTKSQTWYLLLQNQRIILNLYYQGEVSSFPHSWWVCGNSHGLNRLGQFAGTLGSPARSRWHQVAVTRHSLCFRRRNMGNMPTGTSHTSIHLSEEQPCCLKQELGDLSIFLCLYKINSCIRNTFTYFRCRM